MMSQQIQEQLSAFMDGELGRDETRFLIRRAATDVPLVQRWTRFHVIRQTLRRQEIVALRADFSSVVLARIDAEQMPQSPRRASDTNGRRPHEAAAPETISAGRGLARHA